MGGGGWEVFGGGWRYLEVGEVGWEVFGGGLRWVKFGGGGCRWAEVGGYFTYTPHTVVIKSHDLAWDFLSCSSVFHILN